MGGIIESDPADNPEQLAEILGIPLLSKEDSKNWTEISNDVSDKLLEVLLEDEDEIRNIYTTMRTGKYSNNSFSDFYCWYYHYVYPQAIDELIRAGNINMPLEKHSSIILYNEIKDGVLYQ